MDPSTLDEGGGDAEGLKHGEMELDDILADTAGSEGEKKKKKKKKHKVGCFGEISHGHREK